MDENDIAYVKWASKRHGWLLRVGFGARRFKSTTARRLAIRAGACLIRLDRLAWLAFARAPGP